MLLLRHAGVKYHLQQEIAEFVAQIIEIAARDGIGDFIGFFDGVGNDGGEGLFEIPGTARPFRPQRTFSSDAPRPRRVAPDPATAVPVGGKVKWFDDAKGFGFVASDDGGKDVFVHISVLGPAGVSHLAEGQHVNMRVVDTPKGREAVSISL